MLGDYDSLWEARSTNEEFRLRRGGGIVTGLLTYALENKIINKALVTITTGKEPWAKPTIATTPEEIFTSAGSKYIFVPQGRLVKELDEDSAIVGLPCQIKAVSKKNFLKIGLFDGMPITNNGINYLLQQLRIDKQQIKGLDFRAPGGGLRIELNNGEIIRYKSYFWLSYFFAYKHCLKCTDNTSHFADISIGDRKPGWSVVVIRSARGKQLFQNAINDGYIEANEITFEDFLSKINTPFYWKEIRGGYCKTCLIRSRDPWITKMPLSIIKILGLLIYRQTKAKGYGELRKISRK